VTANYVTPLPPPPPPSITSISPSFGSQGHTINITVAGANFDKGTVLSFSGNGINVTSYAMPRVSTQIVATLSITADAASGLRDLVVTNSDSQRAVLSNVFRVVPSSAVILVHGFTGNPSDFGIMKDLLRLDGGLLLADPFDYSDKTPDIYPPNRWTIERLAGELHKHIQCVLTTDCIHDPSFPSGATVDSVDIVAHSMGGLIARAYIADMATDYFDGDSPLRYQKGSIRKLVTAGTPNYGAFLATLTQQFSLERVLTQPKEMEFGSNFLWSLNENWRNLVLVDQRLPGQDILTIAGTTGMSACQRFDDGVVAIPSAFLPSTFLSADEIRYVPYEHFDSTSIQKSCPQEVLTPLVEVQNTSHVTYQLVKNFLLRKQLPVLYSPPASITQSGLLLVRLVDKTTETPLCSQPLGPNLTCSFPKVPLLVDGQSTNEYNNPPAGTVTIWPIGQGAHTVSVPPLPGYKVPPSLNITIENGRPLALAPVELSRAPDLVVTQLGLPSTCLRSGKTQKIGFTVLNQGFAPSPPAHVGFFVSSDASLSPDDVKVADFLVLTALDPNTALNFAINISFPSNIPVGSTVFLIAKVDPDNVIDESSESNNVIAHSTCAVR